MNNQKNKFRATGQKGFIITYILVFGMVFLILLTALLNFILAQLKQAKYELAYEQALHIAEAGIERYKWYLVHKSQEFFSGQAIGCPPSDCYNCAPCQYEYALPGLGVVGKYQLEIEEERSCGITTATTLTATGWTIQFPDNQRTIRVHYARPTVAEYSYILNHNVWAGADRIIMGPYHSNGGIRMDGANNSLVTSEQQEWVCTSSYGCTPCPSQCRFVGGQGCLCPGVFTTANGNEALFRIGVSHFDFEGITVDLGKIKKLTQPPPLGDGKGLYFPPSDRKGYYVIINGRQLTVSKIRQLSRVWTYSEEEGRHWEYSVISAQDPPAYYSLGDCGLVFFEDNIWIEGTIEGKITLASANLIAAGVETDVWLKSSLVYHQQESGDGLVLVGQHNVLIAPDSPAYMDLHGVFIAQTGHFGRNHYDPWTYHLYAKKEKLTIFGSIVSNGREGTKWTSGGSWVSGYRERENIYTPELSFNPPPFLPATSQDFGYRGWEETQ